MLWVHNVFLVRGTLVQTSKFQSGEPSPRDESSYHFTDLRLVAAKTAFEAEEKYCRYWEGQGGQVEVTRVEVMPTIT